MQQQLCIIDDEENLHNANCSHQPSQCFCHNVNWIWARVLGAPPAVRSGKWMLFLSNKNVDAVWTQVKSLLAENQLSYCAKVAPAVHAGAAYLVCIYTQDHDDIADVFRVLKAIRSSGLMISRAIHYKTDEATYRGEYASTSSGVFLGKKLVSKYSSPQVTSEGRLTLIENNIGPALDRVVVKEEDLEGWHRSDRKITLVGKKRRKPSSSSSSSSPLIVTNLGSTTAASTGMETVPAATGAFCAGKETVPAATGAFSAEKEAVSAEIWQCGFCEFKNGGDLISCDLCDTARHS